MYLLDVAGVAAAASGLGPFPAVAAADVVAASAASAAHCWASAAAVGSAGSWNLNFKAFYLKKLYF